MITLTDAAVDKVKGLMAAQEKDSAHLRVFVQGGGCAGFKYGMAFDDSIEETDEIYDFSGLKVLVDEVSSPYLDGAEVDFKDTLEGSGFAITNPNMEASCGCGSSFKQKNAEGAEGGCSSGCCG